MDDLGVPPFSETPIYIYIYSKFIQIWWHLCFRILLFAWLFGWKRSIPNIFTWWGRFYGRTIQNIEIPDKKKGYKNSENLKSLLIPLVNKYIARGRPDQESYSCDFIPSPNSQTKVSKNDARPNSNTTKFQNLHDFVAPFFCGSPKKFPKNHSSTPCASLASPFWRFFCGGKNQTSIAVSGSLNRW